MPSIDPAELSPFFYPSDTAGTFGENTLGYDDYSGEDLTVPSIVLSPASVARSPQRDVGSAAAMRSPASVAQSPHRSYADVVAGPPTKQPLPRSLSLESGSISSTSSINSTPRKEASVRRVAERLHAVKLVHILGLPYKKIGQLRHHMEGLQFCLKDIINMSYLGNRVVECLVRQRGFKSFRKSIRKNGLSLFEQYDPSSDKDNTLVSFLDSSIRTMSSKQIRVEFVRRIANESTSTRDLVAKAFFASWAAGLEMSKEFDMTVKRDQQPSKKVSSQR